MQLGLATNESVKILHSLGQEIGRLRALRVFDPTAMEWIAWFIASHASIGSRPQGEATNPVPEILSSGGAHFRRAWL